MYLTGITLLDGALHRLIHKSFVTTAHRAGGLVWFDSLRPIYNLSVKQGRVFLG